MSMESTVTKKEICRTKSTMTATRANTQNWRRARMLVAVPANMTISSASRDRTIGGPAVAKPAVTPGHAAVRQQRELCVARFKLEIKDALGFVPMAMRSLTGRSMEVDVTALVMVNVFSTPMNMSKNGRISLRARTSKRERPHHEFKC